MFLNANSIVLMFKSYARIFALGRYLFLEAHSSMPANKYPCIFNLRKIMVILYGSGTC